MHAAKDTIAVGGNGGLVELYNANGQKLGRVSVTWANAVVYLLPRGAVAFGSRDGWLGVAEAGGHIAWKRQLGRGIRQRLRIPSAMLLFQGDLLVGMEDESLFRLTVAGREIWNVTCQYHAITRLGAVEINGRPHIVVGTEWGMLDLLDAKGNTIWNEMVGPIASIRSCDLHGTGLQAIACSDWTGIHLLRAADGSVLWNANLGGETLDAVPVKRAAEGFDICTASDIGQVARFDPDGTLVWRSDAQEPLTTMAVGRSVIALGCVSGAVRLYELRGGRFLGMGAMQSAIFKLEAIGPTADRFAGVTEDGKLFAFSVQA
jgi:outer membrane protein assembly factor BamB